MMKLTHDWKAGKLQNGWYFCQFKNDAIFPALCFDNDFDDCQLKVVEVLAPSNYEELQRLKEKLDEALKSSAEFEMKAYDLERDLKSAKSHNRYYLKAIKDMTAALDYMTDENEKCEAKIKKLEQENKQHKENCCCLENEKLRLDIARLQSVLKECEPFIAREAKLVKKTEVNREYAKKIRRIYKDVKSTIDTYKTQANSAGIIKIQESEE